MHTFGASVVRLARHQMERDGAVSERKTSAHPSPRFAQCMAVEAVVAAQGAEHTAALTQVAAPSQHRDDEAMRIRAWTHSRRAIAPRRRRRRKCTVHLDHHPRIRSSTCKLFSAVDKRGVKQIRGTTTCTVGICTVPNCVLYLATFCYISLEKTRLPVLSDPRLVCVPADNNSDGFCILT